MFIAETNLVKSLIEEASIGDIVMLSFSDEDCCSWVYAGELPTRSPLGGPPPERAAIFTDYSNQIDSCMEDRSYHKITGGSSGVFSPGKIGT